MTEDIIVNTAVMRRVAEDLTKLNKKEYYLVVRDVENQLRRDIFLHGDKIFSSLSGIQERMICQGANMGTLRKALLTACLYYESCEKMITGRTESLAKHCDRSTSKSKKTKGTDKRSWFNKLIDNLFHIKRDDKYTHTTAEQQEAADKKMQEAIEKLTNQERFSKETWINASLEERKKILTEYMLCIQGIMGVEFVKDKIHFDYEEPTEDGTLMGYYTDPRREVSINEYVLKKYSPEQSYRLMSTIVHELRHAYQHEAIRHPTNYVVTQETIDAWKESFATYNEECAKGNYRNIVVEQDARSFAKQK